MGGFMATRRGGGTPFYKPYRYVLLQRVWFSWAVLDLKTGIDFPHFVLGLGVVFEVVVSIPNEWEKRVACKFHTYFKKSLCLHSILSNNDKISAYVNMYVVFVTLVCFSENGCGKRLFWSDLGSRFRESGGAPLPRIPRGTPEDKWVIHLAKNWPTGKPRPQGAFPREPGKSTLATRLAYRLLVATSAYNN